MDYSLPSVGSFSEQWIDFFIVAGAIGLVILSTLIWAIFIRKSSKRRRKYRSRRRSKPTLAQSGGLPPVREDKTSLKTPPTPQP